MPWPTYSSTIPQRPPGGWGAAPARRPDRGRVVDDPPAEPGRGHATPQRLLGHPQQLEQLGCHLAHRNGHGGVTVVALDDCPTVDGDDVTRAEDRPLRGDAVDDLGVDRRADAGGEAAIAQERRDRSV